MFSVSADGFYHASKQQDLLLGDELAGFQKGRRTDEKNQWAAQILPTLVA